MMRLLLTALSLAAVIAFCRGCPVDAGFRGGGFHVGWEQRDLVKVSRGWKSLPPAVKARVRSALEAHAGSQFFRRLELRQVQTLDVRALRRQFPEVAERNRELGAYHLLFRFSDRSRGLKYYYFDSFVHEDGTLTKRIPLPETAATPGKGLTISCEAAREKARKFGIPPEFALLDFEFVPKFKNFIWKVADTRKVDPGELRIFEGKGPYRVLLVDAGTGQILDELLETIVI